MIMLEKAKMTNNHPHLKTPAHRGDYGFTAVEIAMVAAVIAILSLIALPIFRNRVEDAKVAAAQADLNALMKAEQVVKADTDAYARLEDLDNVELLGYTTAPPNGVDKEVPYFIYSAPVTGGTPLLTRHQMNDAERSQFAGMTDNPKWRGPYIAFQRNIKYEDFRNAAQYQYYNLLSRTGSNTFQAAIQDYPGGNFHDSDDSRIPVDPWGNPYMFFPPTGNAADPTQTNNGEFPGATIYSMGPNGLPGDGINNPAPTYTHAYAITPAGRNDDSALGKDDDLMVEF